MGVEDKDLKAIHSRLDDLEKLIKTVKGEGISYKISIEHAEFHSPIVEHLDYHFDKLDVKEVSGALNLGNNFGVRVGQAITKPIKKDAIKEEDEKRKPATEHTQTEHTQNEPMPSTPNRSEECEIEKKSLEEAHNVQESDRLSPETISPKNKPQKRKQKPIPSEGGSQTDKQQTSQTKKTPFSKKPLHNKPFSWKSPSDKLTRSKESGSPPIKITFFPRGKKDSKDI
jgi:hypothetical protein